MTWKASTVLESLSALLSADTSFTTIGYSEISYDEDEAIKPIVQLHISKGDMHSPGSGVHNRFQHSFTIQFDIIASSTAEFDLSVINSEVSTPAEKATAIAGGQLATGIAHSKAYTAFQSVFNIVNSVENYDMGIGEFDIKSRQFGEYKIDNTVLSGNLSTVFLMAELDLIVEETVVGLVPEESEDPPVQGIIDGTLPE